MTIVVDVMTPSILLIDDDPTSRVLIERRLQRSEYTVDIAESGLRGLEMAQARPYSLILLDVYMPSYSGLDFLRDAREKLSSPPPIVALSADQDTDLTEHCLELGAQGFLLKPITTDALVTEIDRLLHPPHDDH